MSLNAIHGTNTVTTLNAFNRTNTAASVNALRGTSAVAGTTQTNAPVVVRIHWYPGVQPFEDEAPANSFVLSLFVLVLLTLCCYGVQTLAERQRRALEESREFAVREAQLHSAGRLAAEFVHQIKN